jgi:hypothetical protein
VTFWIISFSPTSALNASDTYQSFQLYSVGDGAIPLDRVPDNEEEEEGMKDELDGADEKGGGIGVAGFGGGTMEETPAGTVGEAVDGLLDATGGANIGPAIPSGSMVPEGGEGKSQNLKRCVSDMCKHGYWGRCYSGFGFFFAEQISNSSSLGFASLKRAILS